MSIVNEDYKRTEPVGTYSNDHKSASEAGKPFTTYIYDSSRSAKDLKASYEKELGMHMGFMNAAAGGGRRKRAGAGSARTMLASFLIGAVVIGGFSYMADKNNLFSAGQAPVEQ